MKNYISTLLFLFLFSSAFAEKAEFEYYGRWYPAIKKERFIDAKFITEIMPGLREKFIMDWPERKRFDQLLKIVEEQQASYVYPHVNFVQMGEKYEEVIDYISIEISVKSGGKRISALGTSRTLTAEQKKLLNSTDLGSDIYVTIWFKFKDWGKDHPDDISKPVRGEYTVAVVPDKEAEFPGGYKQFSDYIESNVLNKTCGKSIQNIARAAVAFTVNEDGQIINSRMFFTSNNSEVDKLILEAIKKMPKWVPAKNACGIRVQQEFVIPFGGPADGC